MSTTRLTQHIWAAPAEVYHVLTDAEAIATWMVPDGMTSCVHRFEAREGGVFRITLTYDAPDEKGKTAAHADTYHGRFVTLIPNEKVVQMMAFETTDPSMQGDMTATFTLKAVDQGTDIYAVHDNVPSGIRPEDNETGWRMSLEKLARLVESQAQAQTGPPNPQ